MVKRTIIRKKVPMSHFGQVNFTEAEEIPQGDVAEPPNPMPPRSTCLSLDTKYSREDTKLRSFVEHTLRENSKIYIFPSGS